MSESKHFKVLIVGAGAGGLSVAARICPKLEQGAVGIIDPSEKHYYQPLWTLVGGGDADKKSTERAQKDLIPKKAVWLKDSVTSFDPEKKELQCAESGAISYDFLVIALGIQIDWDKIPGLSEALGSKGVCSNYSFKHVDYTWDCIKNFKGGKALFTHPSTPIKCGGAPQKIMYLADDAFRRQGVRGESEVYFYSAKPSVFPVAKYAKSLAGVIERKEIQTRFNHELQSLDPDAQLARFKNLSTGEEKDESYHMIHVVPPMSAPDVIKESRLADAAGWIDVDKSTLRHSRYETVFALGDCSNLPTSKTGAAIRKQAPVVAKNLLALIQDKALPATYNGYTSCPLVTGYGKLVLAEFDYQKEPDESFPFDQSKERWSMYQLKKHLLPRLYWHGMLKGRA